MQQLFEEFFELMNNDPSFRKELFVTNNDAMLKMTKLSYNEDFRIDFRGRDEQRAFESFIRGGQKSYALDSSHYNYFYMLKGQNVVDSLHSHNIQFSRDFPIIPPLNISTIEPTREYLCTNMLNVQIDSIMTNRIYLSNESQNSTFKVRLQYDLKSNLVSFDQIEDIYFDNSSTFYSIDLEISYHEFMFALIKNARIRIRNAFTAEEIHTSDPFIPHNIDAGRSYDNIQNKLEILTILRKIQSHWGVYFSNSNISSTEKGYLGAIRNSFVNCSRITSYPFKFSLNRKEASKIIKKENIIKQRDYQIVCDNYQITLLEKQINLGEVVISLPPSNMIFKYIDESVLFELKPLNKNDSIVYDFTDLRSSVRPDFIFHTYYAFPNDSKKYAVVTGLKLDQTSWNHIELCN